MSDPLVTSASTWATVRPRTVDELAALPPDLADGRDRARSSRGVAGLWRRFRVRAERADRVFAHSRDPGQGLPVADRSTAYAFIVDLLRSRRAMAVALIAVNTVAAAIGLVTPPLLGRLVDVASAGDRPGVDGYALAVAAVVLGQAVATFGARAVSVRFGQGLLSEARERVVRIVLGLPLGRVEQASTGDLVTRVTRDVSAMSESARQALPHVVLYSTTLVLTAVALIANSPILAAPMLVGMAGIFLAGRFYLTRSVRGYIAEGAAHSRLGGDIAETVDGVRTVEALGLADQRIAATAADQELTGQVERYTMSLRNILFAMFGFSYQAALVAVLALSVWAYGNDLVTLGQVTAAVLYTQQLSEPLDRIIQVVDRLQIGLASTTRLLGIADVEPDRESGRDRPADEHLVGEDLRFAYRQDHDVLHGVDIDLQPGERLAVVGPSGSGKSTLGRLIAGINRPRTGDVSVGGVDVMTLPLNVLRTEVALVTQEHHVFAGTLRDNIVLARMDATDDQVHEAVAAVGAGDWVERLGGLDAMVGSGHVPLTPGQAQQVALARLVIADPHTLVLDEATSLIDAGTARHLEGAMHVLLSGRSVVAIAHRLHTAHDADRIAVVTDGRITEIGSHEDLLALDGQYAALWRAWTS